MGTIILFGNKFRVGLLRDRDFYLYIYEIKKREKTDKKNPQQSKRVHQEIGSKHRNNPIDYKYIYSGRKKKPKSAINNLTGYSPTKGERNGKEERKKVDSLHMNSS